MPEPLAGDLNCTILLTVQTEAELEPIFERIRDHVRAGLTHKVGTALIDWGTIKSLRFSSEYVVRAK